MKVMKRNLLLSVSALPMMFLAVLPLTSCKENRTMQDSYSSAPAVDAETAMKYASDFFDLGPKPYRSEQLETAAEWIRQAAGPYADSVYFPKCGTEDEKIVNVVAEFSGHDTKHFIVIGCHFDTKQIFSAPAFAGANDGASGVGAVLALMKAIREQKMQLPCTLRFVFFDGEECLYQYSNTDGLHGSRGYVQLLQDSGTLSQCKAMILLDMIGDRDLVITPPTNSNAKLIQESERIAAQLGRAKSVQPLKSGMLDDHLPFVNAGVPSIDLIDFSYGEQNLYWHTSADTPDKISGESMKFAAELAVRLYLFAAENDLGGKTGSK